MILMSFTSDSLFDSILKLRTAFGQQPAAGSNGLAFCVLYYRRNRAATDSRCPILQAGQGYDPFSVLCCRQSRTMTHSLCVVLQAEQDYDPFSVCCVTGGAGL